MLCPKCGCPARIKHVSKTSVRVSLESGKVLSTSREKENIVAYECNGGHVWPAKKIEVE